MINYSDRFEVVPNCAEAEQALSLVLDKLDYPTYIPVPAVKWMPTEEAIQAYVDNTPSTNRRYRREDRLDMAQPLPSNYFYTGLKYVHWYYASWTGATQFPEIPTPAPDVDYMYMSLAWTLATGAEGMGASNVTTFPDSWANLTGLQRINAQRQTLSAAQQIAILQSLENVGNLGMGQAYTGTHLIYFNSASSGKNDPLPKADLQAIGWTDITSIVSEKVINGRTWRVTHLT